MLKRIKYISLMATLLCLLTPTTTQAHPHAFVDARVTVVFDDKGLAGFRQEWTLDEMLTVTVLDLIAENGDGNISQAESQAICTKSFGVLKEYHYFNDIRIDGKPFHIDWTKDFTARLDGAKLVYSFFIPCHVLSASTEKVVKMAIYDESFYTYINYADDHDLAIDPTKDPMFANSSIGATPEDFARFSKSVGLDSYSGQVLVETVPATISATAKVEAAKDMSYFYDQIVPDAFVVRFKSK